MKITFFLSVLFVGSFALAGMKGASLEPAQVSIRNLSGAIPKAVVSDADGEVIASLQQVSASRFESSDGGAVIRSSDGFKKIEVILVDSELIYSFVCQKESGVVPIQPDGTQDSLECQPHNF